MHAIWGGRKYEENGEGIYFVVGLFIGFLARRLKSMLWYEALRANIVWGVASKLMKESAMEGQIKVGLSLNPLPQDRLFVANATSLPDTKPHDHFIFLTNRVGRQLSRLLLEQMEFEGFLPQRTHMGLIADLVENDGLRQQDLAISTIKDKGTVARALKQLESAGILMRKVDAEDRRQKLIRLTDKGNRLWQFAKCKAMNTMETATLDIEPTELDTCINVLQRVYQNLHQQLSIPQTSNS